MSTKFDDESLANYATLDYVFDVESRVYERACSAVSISDSLAERLSVVEQSVSEKIADLDLRINTIAQWLNLELFAGIIDRVEKYLERKEAGYMTCDDEFIDSLKSLFEDR